MQYRQYHYISVPNLNSQKCTWKYKGYSLGAFTSICPAAITKNCSNSGVILMQTQKTSSFRHQIFSGIVLFCSYLPETQNFYATAGGKRKKKWKKKMMGYMIFQLLLINSLYVKMLEERLNC